MVSKNIIHEQTKMLTIIKIFTIILIIYYYSNRINENDEIVDDQNLNQELIDINMDIDSVQETLQEIYCDNPILRYSGYDLHARAHEEFRKSFTMNDFGYACSVCDRLWFKNDLKKATQNYEEVLKTIIEVNESLLKFDQTLFFNVIFGKNIFKEMIYRIS